MGRPVGVQAAHHGGRRVRPGEGRGDAAAVGDDDRARGAHLWNDHRLEGMADRYMPDWKERQAPTTPATRQLRDAYEQALLREHEISPELVAKFSGLVGALLYAAPCARPDVNQTVSLLARALTFPTPELMRCAERALLYLAHTSELGMTIDGNLPDADVLDAESDSDWSIGHSTTGYLLFLCGCAIVYSSKRQPCIALSSTEAEIIAASATAVEIVYVRTLLRELGLEQDRPTTLRVDNSGAVELSRDRKSCHRSRHVDRRFFKVRELNAAEVLRVEHVPTELNRADYLTKPLDETTFIRHRTASMNTRS